MMGRENPPGVLTVKDRIDVEGPEHKRVVYKRLRAMVEGFIGRVRCRLAYGRLTWQGLGNAGIHVSLVLCVVYAVAIAMHLLREARVQAEHRLFHLNGGLG
jgi:hypothetical protein